LISEILAITSMMVAVLVPYLLLRRLKRFEKLADTVEELFTVQYAEDGEPMVPEKTAVFLTAISKSLAQSLKMSVLGSMSGPARLEKGLKGAFVEDIVDKQLPMLKLIEPLLGMNVMKYIKKNPEALAQIMQFAGPMLQGAGQGGASGSTYASNPYKK